MINIIKKTKGLTLMQIQSIVTKIVIGSAIPVALAVMSFLYDLRIGQDKLIIITEQKFLRQEDNNKDQQKQIDELKVKVETLVTRTELLETMKRIELYLEASKASPVQDFLKLSIKKEISKFNNEK